MYQIKYHDGRASGQTKKTENMIVSTLSKAVAYLKLLALISASAMTLTVSAADAAKVENLRVTNACKYCDLTDAALAGMDLRGEIGRAHV